MRQQLQQAALHPHDNIGSVTVFRTVQQLMPHHLVMSLHLNLAARRLLPKAQNPAVL